MPIIPEIDPVIDAAYDAPVDVLYLSIGPPQVCNFEEEIYDCLVRRSVSDGKISGLTLIGFREWFVPKQILPKLQANQQLPDSLLQFLARLVAEPEMLLKYAFEE
jgi:uncharacterized protein YuzE